MIVNKQLVVSGKKRQVIETELKSKEFKPISTNQAMDDSEEEPAGQYNYLLSMSIWSLTTEKVEKLLKDKGTKEAELNVLLGKSAKDLWNEDLDSFMEEWELTLAQDAELVTKEKNQKKLKSPAAKKRAKGEDDYMPTKGTPKKPKQSAKPPAKPAAPKIAQPIKPVKQAKPLTISDDEDMSEDDFARLVKEYKPPADLGHTPEVIRPKRAGATQNLFSSQTTTMMMMN